MPIPRQQFELGVTPEVIDSMKRVYDYLRAHSGFAFTNEELAENFGVRSVADITFSAALLKLTELGTAESRWIAGNTYYTLGAKPLEL